MCSVPSVYTLIWVCTNVRSSEVCFSATCRFIGIVDYLNDSVKCIFVQIIIFQHNYYTSTLKNNGVLIVSIP